MAGFAVQDVLSKPFEPAALIDALTRAGVSPTPSGTVLVVDDDEVSLKLISAALKQLGYQTRCERDGAAGLRALREGGAPPSVVILDLVMPGMNGFEFLERLRREPAGRRVPVIVWTVKDLTPQERVFLRTAAQAVVDKGQGGAGVLAELDAVVRRKPAAVSGAELKLVSYLLSRRGYQVQSAAGAREALEALQTFRPALILMDMQMPGIDGFELTRRLKADPATHEIIIIALTAYAMKGDEERVRAAGCDGYMPKPIDTRTLPLKVASWIAGERP